MRIDELFDVEYGNQLDMNKMTPAAPAEGVVFVGRKGSNQGVSGYVAEITGLKPFSADLLTVALGGSRLLATFVQRRPFYTAQNVAVLRPKRPLTLQEKLYYAACIEHNRFRYSAFGREANRSLRTIEIPNEAPAWARQAKVPDLDDLRQPAGQPQLVDDVADWGNFLIGEIFEMHKGKRVTKANRTPGSTRFIGATESNNGVTDMVDLEPNFGPGCITVAYNGSVGWAFYQDQEFFACDDVNVLVPREKDLSPFTLLFCCAVLRYERLRFSYGYKWTMERMRSTTIRMPQTDTGSPHWKRMEDIMKGLPLSKTLEREKTPKTEPDVP